MTLASPFGSRLRHWRQLRGLSQLDLAARARSTPRHVSFLETGRSRPTEAMVLRLAEVLEVPLRSRNDLLTSAGLPPIFSARALADEALRPFRVVIDRLLAQQEPFPAFVIDAGWRIVQANRGAGWLLPPGGLPADALGWLFEPGPLRDGLLNHADLAWHAVDLLRADLTRTADPALEARLARAVASLEGTPRPSPRGDGPVRCPRFRVGDRVLSTITTVVRFGSPLDVTLEELRVELVFPGDVGTEQVMRALAAGQALP